MRCKQIVRFNWPFYGGAALTLLAGPFVIARLPHVWWLRAPAWIGVSLVALWLVASLLASWIVYDRSQLMEWTWLLQALGFSPQSWVNIHAGHDESSEALRRLFPGAPGRVLDIFAPEVMTERSIARARRVSAVHAEHADFRHLPVSSGSVDVATLLLSAHELRRDEERRALFTELRRILGPGGRVVVAEHLRDWKNFLAYGPGFLHFHSRRTWLACFARHRFDVHREFAITPFVRIFVLRRLT